MLMRMAMHASSIFSLYLGTKLSVIGLTGGIACGKSTVVEVLQKSTQPHFKVIDSDRIVHDLYKDQAFTNKIFATFGKENVATADGKSVDRAKLGKIVFADDKKRRQLNSMTHWRVFMQILWTIIRLKAIQGHPLVILDAPLLFESKVLEYICHPIVCVSLSDEQTQIKRLTGRNTDVSRNEAVKRIKA